MQISNIDMRIYQRKVKVGSAQEMAQSERNSHSKKTMLKKTKLKIRYLRILRNPYRMPSEQLFPSYPNLTKNMKTTIGRKQHKNTTPKLKQVEPPQKNRLGTISNIKLLAGLK